MQKQLRKVLILLYITREPKALTDVVKTSHSVLWCVQMIYCTKLIGGTGSPIWLQLSSRGVGSRDNGSTRTHTLLTREYVHSLQREFMKIHHGVDVLFRKKV